MFISFSHNYVFRFINIIVCKYNFNFSIIIFQVNFTNLLFHQRNAYCCISWPTFNIIRLSRFQLFSPVFVEKLKVQIPGASCSNFDSRFPLQFCFISLLDSFLIFRQFFNAFKVVIFQNTPYQIFKIVLIWEFTQIGYFAIARKRSLTRPLFLRNNVFFLSPPTPPPPLGWYNCQVIYIIV